MTYCKARGWTGMDKSLVSRTCKELDTPVDEFRNRPLEDSHPYVWFDAVYLKVRQNHRSVSLAAVIAIGVCETGERGGAGPGDRCQRKRAVLESSCAAWWAGA